MNSRRVGPAVVMRNSNAVLLRDSPLSLLIETGTYPLEPGASVVSPTLKRIVAWATWAPQMRNINA